MALKRLQFVDEVTYETYFPPRPDDRKLSLKSFRNLWELDNRQREVLVFLINWYNQLDGSRKSGVSHRKTLLSIARRMPRSMGELLEIKGVNRRWGGRDGPTVIDTISDIIASHPLVEEARIPQPYASFDDLYTDAWFQCARADVCATAQIAPELAFPGWLVKSLRTQLDESQDFAYASALFDGWRGFLGEYWRRFCVATKGH